MSDSVLNRIWGSSSDKIELYELKKDFGLLPHGSIFEVNRHDTRSFTLAPGLLSPVFCTVHIRGSFKKLYMNKYHFKLMKNKLRKVSKNAG